MICLFQNLIAYLFIEVIWATLTLEDTTKSQLDKPNWEKDPAQMRPLHDTVYLDYAWHTGNS